MTKHANSIHYNQKRHRRNSWNHHNSRRTSDLTEESLAQIRDEGYGRLYIQKQIQHKTPMVFELYNETISETRIVRLTKYFMTLLLVRTSAGNREIRNINKLDIKYCFKQSDAHKIRTFIEYDEKIRDQNLLPIVNSDERFHVDAELVAKCYQENRPVTVSLRGGEIISGTIDWYSKYEIKIKLPSRRSVVAYQHAYYDFQA